MKTSKMTKLFLIAKRMNAELMDVHAYYGYISSSALSKDLVLIEDYEAPFGSQDSSTYLYGGMKFSETVCETCFSGNHRVVRPVWREKNAYDFPSRECNRGKKRYRVGTMMFNRILFLWTKFDLCQTEMGDGNDITIDFKQWVKREYPHLAVSLVQYKKRNDSKPSYIDPDDLPF